jgi:hypothetical protein
MSNWIKERFRDAQHARETVAIGGFVVGALGALTTLKLLPDVLSSRLNVSI